MRKRLPGYSISLDRKKQYSQSRLQMAPVGLAITWKARGASSRVSMPLLAHEHGDGLALEVGVRLATDVDGNPFDRAAGEAPRHLPGIVPGDAFPGVAPYGESLAGQRELAGLGLDRGLADLLVAVEQRQGPVCDAGWILAGLLERRGEDQVVAGWDVLITHDLLGEAAHKVVDVVQAVVLDVERVPAEASTLGEQHSFCVRRGQVDQGSDREGAVAHVDRL